MKNYFITTFTKKNKAHRLAYFNRLAPINPFFLAFGAHRDIVTLHLMHPMPQKLLK
jgi:hypothetical protein